ILDFFRNINFERKNTRIFLAAHSRFNVPFFKLKKKLLFTKFTPHFTIIEKPSKGIFLIQLLYGLSELISNTTKFKEVTIGILFGKDQTAPIFGEARLYKGMDQSKLNGNVNTATSPVKQVKNLTQKEVQIILKIGFIVSQLIGDGLKIFAKLFMNLLSHLTFFSLCFFLSPGKVKTFLKKKKKKW
ncbi:hypothetical protein RFI_17127, partial [Reticulomyxa filosa]